MKKKWLKRSSAILLSLTMALSLFPGMKGTVPTVLAAGNKTPKSAYWTNVSGLKNFSLDETRDTEGRIIFGQNGSGAAQQWKIAGTDSGIDGDDIILFAASRLGYSKFEDDNNTNKPYDANWNCTYLDGITVSEVFPNHYGASDLRTALNSYMSGNSYFSASEKTKMNLTTIYTDDKNNNTTYSVTDTLYAPYGDYNAKYVTVGTNTSDSLNGGVRINSSKLGINIFWLRSPEYADKRYGIVATNTGVGMKLVDEIAYVVPAFDLNLSDVSFASAAEAASSSYSGFKANNTDNTMTANTYTLRYKSSGNEEAVISPDGTKIEVAGANGKYLMVQNSTGVYAMKIDFNNQTINASDIQMGSAKSDKLANFNNCKVWLESTDEDRITTAKMARQDTAPPIDTVNVTGIIAPSAGSAFDTEAACATTGVSTTTPTVTWIQGGESVTGNAGYNTTYTASVTLTAADGYEFASGVTATVNGQNATSVTKNADGTVTVEYTFPETTKVKLTGIITPTGITVANGTAYAAMGLPTNVAIVTEGNTETTAEVTWNTTTPASGSYNPTLTTEQTVTLNGTVTCPNSVDANGVALTTTITITIRAAGAIPTTPGTTTPSQPKPENPTPAQPTPEQPKPEEPKPEEPKPEKPQKPKVEVLPAKASVTDNRQVTLTWDKVDGAEGYRIYRKVKGSKDGYQRVATTRNLQLVQKQLDNKKTYQYYIVAYKTIDGKKARIGKTLTLYAVMNNVKYTEVKKIKLNKKSYSLEVGAKAKIKAVLLKRENKKKIKAESEKLRFCSTDNTVAKVNASGTITAKGAGTCYIYVVAGNGISQKIKVTVSKEK